MTIKDVKYFNFQLNEKIRQKRFNTNVTNLPDIIKIYTHQNFHKDIILYTL